MGKFNMLRRGLSKISLLTIGTLLLVILVYFAMGSVESTNLEEKKKALEEAVMRCAIHCYSLEGAYPTDLSYLEENYSLTIDHDSYIVHYEAFAGNIAPDITVIAKSE